MTDVVRSQKPTFNRKKYMRQYYLENQEKINAYQKAYASKNKEYLARYFKKYAKDNFLKISERNHEWRLKSKEHRVSYNKEYYKNNKEVMNERASQRIKCGCGASTSYGNQARHCKSKKHQKYLACLAHLNQGINPS